MRIKNKIETIDAGKVRGFFNRRTGRYDPQNPYSAVLFRDDDPVLLEKRSREEIRRLLPLLDIDEQSRVLDLACGIGRWLDALPTLIDAYCGIDFSPDMIAIANSRNRRENASFLLGSTTELRELLSGCPKGFNRVLMMGLLQYMNDEDILKMFEQIPEVCENSGGGLYVPQGPGKS